MHGRVKWHGGRQPLTAQELFKDSCVMQGCFPLLPTLVRSKYGFMKMKFHAGVFKLRFRQTTNLEVVTYFQLEQYRISLCMQVMVGLLASFLKITGRNWMGKCARHAVSPG